MNDIRNRQSRMPSQRPMRYQQDCPPFLDVILSKGLRSSARESSTQISEDKYNKSRLLLALSYNPELAKALVGRRTPVDDCPILTDIGLE